MILLSNLIVHSFAKFINHCDFGILRKKLEVVNNRQYCLFMTIVLNRSGIICQYHRLVINASAYVVAWLHDILIGQLAFNFFQTTLRLQSIRQANMDCFLVDILQLLEGPEWEILTLKTNRWPQYLCIFEDKNDILNRLMNYRGFLPNATFGSWKKSHQPKIALAKF